MATDINGVEWQSTIEYDDADDVDRCIYCGETRPAETR